ncbi:unnamed protein product, partial [Brachionus calyciflorus]
MQLFEHVLKLEIHSYDSIQYSSKLLNYSQKSTTTTITPTTSKT